MSNALLRALGYSALSLVLVGCGARLPTTQYYLLATSSTEHASSATLSQEMAIAVGPVVISDYLDQPLVVTRTDDDSYRLQEYARWASPLGDLIQESIIARLSGGVPAAAVAAFPNSHGFQYDYRIGVDVVRLDGTLARDVFLEARWRVFRMSTGDQLSEHRLSTKIDVDDHGYRALVAAEGRLIDELADSIASYMRDVESP